VRTRGIGLGRWLLLPVFGALIVVNALGDTAQDPVLSRESLAHAESLRDSALAGSAALEIVTQLTTEVGPRLAGSESEARARQWAVNRLSLGGFASIREETFSLDAWQRHSERARIISPYPQPLSVAALGGSVSTPEAGLSGPVRVFETLEALQRAPVGSLNGYIAYVGHAMQKTQDGSSYGYFNAARTQGASIAAERGATAYLIRSIGTDSHRFPHTGSMRYAEDQPKIPALALSNPDADQLERITAMGQTPVVELTVSSSVLPGAVSGNVIAEIRGREAPEEIVVIGAHLDSWDLGTGAVDDGAGVGITLAAMELIQSAGLAPRRTIRLVLWGSEEVGLFGARVYRDAHLEELEQHIVGSESDFGGGRIWKVSVLSESEEGDQWFKEMAALLAPLGIAPGSDDEPGGGPDMTPLAAAGVPTLRLHQDGRDYFDLHHTADDTVDKLDGAALDQNVAAFAVMAWLAADTTISLRSRSSTENRSD
jgi:carboxypeptidase Q